MTTAGPNAPGTLANDSAVGSVAWSNPGNAGSSNDSYATFSGAGVQSNYLKVSNFGFAIPAGATINGVQAAIERKSANATSIRNTRDTILRLTVGDVVSGDNKAATGTNWPTTDATANYGGAADLWGLTPSVSDINGSGFGLVLSATTTGITTGSVDAITITITYTVSGTTYTQSVTGSVSGTGTLKIEVRRGVAGAVTGAGVLGRVTGRGVFGAATVTGAVWRTACKAVVGSVAVAGALTVARTIILVLVGSIAAVGGLARRVGRSVGASVAGAGAVGRSVGRGVGGSVTGAGGLARRIGRVVAGSVTGQGAVSRRTGKGLTGSSGATGVINRATRKGVTGAVTGAGAINRTTRKGLTGSLSPAGVLSAIRSAGVFLVNLAGSLTANGALGRAARKGLTGQTQAQGTIGRATRKGLVGSLTATGIVGRIRSLLLSVGGAVAPVGSVSKCTSKEQVSSIYSSGAVVKRIGKRLAGLLTSFAELIGRLFGTVKRGVVYVSDRAVTGLGLAMVTLWAVDLMDLELVNRVTTGTRPVTLVRVDGKLICRVAIGDTGGQ